MWRIGSKLLHPYNPELGVGGVRALEGRFLKVFFPLAGVELTLSPSASGIERLVLPAGARAVLLESDEEVTIASAAEHSYILTDGRMVDDGDLWPILGSGTPLERLAGGSADSVAAFRNRIDGLRLLELREASGLGRFLGGRIELFAHQLHTAQQAVSHDPVRWLLADEVGLGKTVEACLILSALVRTGRAKRALLVVPETLTVQWLGELYRKFHQIFVLLDSDRLESVASDFGDEVNPFEVHPYAVIAQETLLEDPRLRDQARAAELDLIIVDEAHRLAVEHVAEVVHPLVSEARHALLLTATPLSADRRGFYELIASLRPGAFDSFEDFLERVEAGTVSLSCTSSVRRSDVGGLPPRVASKLRVPLPDTELRKDARVMWLVENAQHFADASEKALVFVSEVSSLRALHEHLEARVHLRIPVFHEGLDPGMRDIEIAQFRDSTCPLLLCSEAGGEGRNFQFCDRMVHFDLPLDPALLEQRIGRLDRIGRRKPVEIIYFQHEGSRFDVAGLYERLGVFERPGAGFDSSLILVREELEDLVERGGSLDVDALRARVEAARAEAPERNVVQVFYPDAYRASMEDEVLAQVPKDLDALTMRFCLKAAEALGLEVVEKDGAARYYIEFGSDATVESLPGVPGDARFLGTFSRQAAVRNEEIDYFASGHPLVEGLLLELEDGERGRAACLEIPCALPACAGLLLIWKMEAVWSVEVIDVGAVPRPDWVEPLLAGLENARASTLAQELDPEVWAEKILGLGEVAQGEGEMVAAAFFRSRPQHLVGGESRPAKIKPDGLAAV